MFDKDEILKNMESLRRQNGAFIAAPTPDYNAVWIRDQLYISLAYYYLRDYKKLKAGVWTVFDLLKKHESKLKNGGVLHAKFNADTLEEITGDFDWGHHQLDALGLFLYIAAKLANKKIKIIRNKKDLEILQLTVNYLNHAAYWNAPDYGMWEESKELHLSSIGAVLAGLSRIKQTNLIILPNHLIDLGWAAYQKIFPNESAMRDCDAAQLTLIWPYHLVTDLKEQDLIISRLVEGHQNHAYHRLLQSHGFNRYWGDHYYRSANGVSAEWPMFKFWLSIIYSERSELKKAAYWFEDGCKEIVSGKIPEAYQNGKPNDHTPLGWAHAIALIAYAKLPQK